MKFSRERIHYLLNRNSDQTIAAAEAEELMKWLAESEDDGPFREHVQNLLNEYPAGRLVEGVDWSRIYRGILKGRNNDAVAPVHRVHFLKTAWFRYAAVLLLISGTAALLYQTNQKPAQEIVEQPLLQPADIIPAGNKAVLILADGSSIVLDSVANGNLAAQGNTSIIKLNTGMLSYSPGKQLPENGEVLYNTIRTPKGGQYQVELPDGTMVWLNAASSITFPTFFTKEREVTISGEAYLEVARDKNKAFSITANGTQIQVLGTSLNVNCYADEPATLTTLIEGEIKVIKNKQSILLHPGEQAEVRDAIKLNKAIKLNQVLAWKNGLFNFQNKKLEEVMRQLARWYDLEIEYPASVPDITFVGGISRNMKLSDMLKTLEQSEVYYKMEGRKLIILP